MLVTSTTFPGSSCSSNVGRRQRRFMATVVASAVLALSGASLTASAASASVNSWDKKANALKGSMSAREFGKVYRALAKQNCVTPREVDKIAKARHAYAGRAGKGRKVYMWDGRKADDARYYSLIFNGKKCLVYGEPTFYDYVY